MNSCRPRCAVALWLALWAGGALPSPPALADDAASVVLDATPQLLVDDWLFVRVEHATRELTPAEKLNAGRPVFTDGRLYGTVLYDEERFKFWYRKLTDSGYGYAESHDGLAFTHVADVTGLNFAGDYTLAVALHGRTALPEHRYLGAYDGPGMAAAIATSADGIAWTPLHDGQPVTGRAADTYNQLWWDERAAAYRLFTRTDFGSAGGADELRGTRSMLNPDIFADPTDWTTVREWKFDADGPAEAQRRQVYAQTAWLQHGVYFSLLTVYEWPGDLSEGPQDAHARHERDVLNAYLATSRDGSAWDLSWVYAGRPLIERGGDGAFDKDLIVPASQLATHDGWHWLYYLGADERHGTPAAPRERRHAVGVARIPQDRLIGYSAGAAPGVLETRPLQLHGARLQLNAAAAEGSIRVEVLNAAGRELPEFCGENAALLTACDARDCDVRWPRGALTAVADRPLRLRFTLRQACLYSVRSLAE